MQRDKKTSYCVHMYMYVCKLTDPVTYVQVWYMYTDNRPSLLVYFTYSTVHEPCRQGIFVQLKPMCTGTTCYFSQKQRYRYTPDDEDDQLYETPLNYAARFVENNDDDAAMSNTIQIVELLCDAGGTARDIPREEWLAEQNELMEATPSD